MTRQLDVACGAKDPQPPTTHYRLLLTALQGCVGFEMYCATNEQDQQLLDDVHVQVCELHDVYVCRPGDLPTTTPLCHCATMLVTLHDMCCRARHVLPSRCGRTPLALPSRRVTTHSRLSRATRSSNSYQGIPNRSTGARSPSGV